MAAGFQEIMSIK